MLTHDGQVRIVDFGLAKVVSETQETVARMTATGTTVGTAAYMAPEQATGLDVSARADIWAFGVTFYEMLTGRLPFDGRTAPALLLAVATQSPPAIRGLRPDVPEALEGIVERALEKDPARRTLSADSCGRDRPLAVRSSAADGCGPGRRTTAKWWAAIAAVALAAAGPALVHPPERANAGP
jgi:serine/threonine-protein kinase